MKYQKPEIWRDDFGLAGTVYRCESPIFSECLLFQNDGIGFALIQQRYDSATKHTWWGVPDRDISDSIYFSPDFPFLFRENASSPVNGVYPYITVRQAMRALHIPPLEKEPWETRF